MTSKTPSKKLPPAKPPSSKKTAARRKQFAPAKKKAAGAVSPGDEKLQKALAACGIGSRRAMELLIQQGRVTVNRQTATLGMRVRPRDALAVEGRPIRRRTAAAQWLCYHKPPGKIVERGAPNSVFADLPPTSAGRWINVGRLDVNSEGLLLFCTDGGEVQRLAHPRHAAEREYLARADGELTPPQIQQIQNGVEVDGRPLRPLLFELHEKTAKPGGRNHWYRLVLSEGRNRIVRRLFAQFNLQVARLIRLRMGEFSLPRDLRPGKWRRISPSGISPSAPPPKKAKE